jgi:hypothetical protein
MTGNIIPDGILNWGWRGRREVARPKRRWIDQE